jgi:hypothetical protein
MPRRYSRRGGGGGNIPPGAQPPQSALDALLNELRSRPVPDFIQSQRGRALEQARELFPEKEVLDGDRPATAHRGKEAVEALPPGVFERMDGVVTSRFESLVEGRDYSRKAGSMLAPGYDYFRSVILDLPEPVTLAGHPIDAVKLKGACFRQDQLDKEFDLWRAQAELMGRQTSPLFMRMDFYFPPSGIVEATPHINEPLGAEFLYEAAGEARGGKLIQDAGGFVDVPLAWYEYDKSIKPPSGLRLGVMASGHIAGSRVNVGAAMHDLYLAYQGRLQAGDKAATAEWKWKTGTEELFTRYVLGVAGLHDDGKGFFHESPHPGQFHVINGRTDRLLVSDLGFSRPLAGMTYEQKIACLAHDLKSVLAYAEFYDSNPLAAQYGIDFFGMAFKYFNRVTDSPAFEQLKELSKRGPSGRLQIEHLFQTSGEQQRPLTDYKDNPLIKLLTQEYPRPS